MGLKTLGTQNLFLSLLIAGSHPLLKQSIGGVGGGCPLSTVAGLRPLLLEEE